MDASDLVTGQEADPADPPRSHDARHAPPAMTPSLAELCLACPVRRRAAFRPFDAADLAFVQRSVTGRRGFVPEADLLRAGELGGGPCVLWEGWAYRHRPVPTEDGRGSRQQIVEILLPGDVFGLECALTGRAGSSVRALTAVVVCAHDPRVLLTVFGKRPELARALLETQLRDRELSEARLAAIGGGSGAQRAAHLMLELRDRLDERGMLPAAVPDGAQRLPFPLRRRHLAAALGMSGTHVNRSLAELEAAGLARLDGEVLMLPAPARLAALCGHAPAPQEAGRRALL